MPSLGRAQVLADDDISTKFHWTRPHMLSSESRAEILWTIPAGTPAGSYRCGLHTTHIIVVTLCMLLQQMELQILGLVQTHLLSCL